MCLGHVTMMIATTYHTHIEIHPLRVSKPTFAQWERLRPTRAPKGSHLRVGLEGFLDEAAGYGIWSQSLLPHWASAAILAPPFSLTPAPMLMLSAGYSNVCSRSSVGSSFTSGHSSICFLPFQCQPAQSPRQQRGGGGVHEGASETFKDAKPPIIISSFSLSLLRFYL